MPIKNKEAETIIEKAANNKWSLSTSEDDDFAELLSFFCAPYRHILYHSDTRCNQKMEFMSNGATTLCGDCEDSAIANCQFITSFLACTDLKGNNVLNKLQQAININYDQGLSAMYLKNNTGHMVAVLVPKREGPRLLVIEGTFIFSNRKKEKTDKNIIHITKTCVEQNLWVTHPYINFESIALAKDEGLICPFNTPFNKEYNAKNINLTPIKCSKDALTIIKNLANALIPIPKLHTAAQSAYETEKDEILKKNRADFVKILENKPKPIGTGRVDYVSFVFNIADKKKLKLAEDFLTKIEKINENSKEFTLVIIAEECNIIPHLYTVMMKIYADPKSK
jgi:hypothetical protein